MRTPGEGLRHQRPKSFEPAIKPFRIASFQTTLLHLKLKASQLHQAEAAAKAEAAEAAAEARGAASAAALKQAQQQVEAEQARAATATDAAEASQVGFWDALGLPRSTMEIQIRGPVKQQAHVFQHTQAHDTCTYLHVSDQDSQCKVDRECYERD